MVSTFFDRIDDLAEQVGVGSLQMKVVVDQVYAHYQHEGVSMHGRPLTHPHGGQDFYLRDPLYNKIDERMQKLADATLSEDGSKLKSAMIDAAEELSEDVFELAPKEFNDLAESGHPSVTDDGATIYDRPPRVGRLSEEQLKAKSRERSRHSHAEIRRRATVRSKLWRS
jgi:hypothetical protein